MMDRWIWEAEGQKWNNIKALNTKRGKEYLNGHSVRKFKTTDKFENFMTHPHKIEYYIELM